MGEHHLTLDDTIDNLGRTVLGFNIACARCHDHKFDPFTISDYYGLYGIFSSTRYPFPGAEVGMKQEDFVPIKTAGSEESLERYRARLAEVEAEVKKLEAAEAEVRKAPDGAGQEGARHGRGAGQLPRPGKSGPALQAEAPASPTAYAVADGKAANAKIHVRGDPKQLGDEVPRHFPAVLGGQQLPRDCSGSGRLQLADWLTDPKNPLTGPRHGESHLAAPLRPGDRGDAERLRQPGHAADPSRIARLPRRPLHRQRLVREGAAPAHPAVQRPGSWPTTDVPASVHARPGQRAVLEVRRAAASMPSRSATRCSSSAANSTSVSGANIRSRRAEAWGFTQHAPFVAVYETRRRSVYLMQQRLRKQPYLALFDGADPSSSTGTRTPSTTPLQALFLMNDPLVHESAKQFARHALEAAPAEAARLALMYQQALGRLPTPDEERDCVRFLKNYRDRLMSINTPADQVELLSWAALARALMSGNEFVFVD